MGITGDLMILRRRMPFLREAIRRKRWADAQLGYDQINRALSKLEEDIDRATPRPSEEIEGRVAPEETGP